MKLVIVGHQYMRLNVPRGVIILDHIENEEMPSALSGAKVLAYPSLYEGFGLPILEGFSCKVPVVTSNLGSMAETAGDGAILVEPESVKSIAQGLELAMKNEDNLVKKGLFELKKYSWEKTAKATLSVYKESIKT